VSHRPSFGVLLQGFFSEHLRDHRGASPHTVDAYRDAFRLLLSYLQTRGKAPAIVAVADLDAPTIIAFLDHLEHTRSSTVRSRNARLAAIRSFFRYVVLKDPESVGVATRVLAIPAKKADRCLVGYLTRPEVEALLGAPDRTEWSGRRDHALLMTMYNTGARLSEVTGLERGHVRLTPSPFVHLHGKGRKDREVPLWASTARVLRSWLEEIERVPGGIVFPNAAGGRLSADGVSYILGHALRAASGHCPSLATKRVTPHVLRHTTAMHLLQSGVDLAVIALWLGHESVETTHVYVEADLATKERALSTLTPVGAPRQRFTPTDSLLAFLASV
jgi:integrase/recombinase XerD